MHTDPRGHDLTTASADAAAALEDMTLAFLAQGAATARHLDRTLAADPGLVIALAARGLFALLLGRRELTPTADAALAAAKTSLAERDGTVRERGYVAALDRLTRGDFTGAITALDRLLADAPTDALAARLAHGLRFMTGDAAGMRHAAEAIRPAWHDDLPGAGYIAGCHAFALEETGDYAAAEREGRHALALAPDDRWGLHAVAHVFEMQDRPHAGLDWFDAHPAITDGASNFGYHLFWHRALFHLALGDMAAVLALYDHAVRANETDDFRDIANATSLLFRLERQGVDVGGRWTELADKAAARDDDHAYCFADAHYLLALTGARRLDTAANWLATIATATDTETTQAAVAHRVGLPLGQAILAFAQHRYGEAVDHLLPIRHDLTLLGGSHAQRDVFHQLLIDAALAAGRHDAARHLIDDRLRDHPANTWTLARARRLADLTPVA